MTILFNCPIVQLHVHNNFRQTSDSLSWRFREFANYSLENANFQIIPMEICRELVHRTRTIIKGANF